MAAEGKGGRMSPSDEGAQEVPPVIQRSVLLLLPPEMWEFISEKVLEASFNDHQNLVNSSLFFRNIRASQRTAYLFEQVFPLLAKYVWETDGTEGLARNDVLNWRRVCKKWEGVINKMISQFTYGDKVERDSKGNSVGDVFVLRNDFDWPIHPEDSESRKTKSVQGFMQHFEPTHDPKKGRDPFICGNFSVFLFPSSYYDVHRDEEKVMAYQRYQEEVGSMLAKYGHHVRRFHLVSEQCVFANLSLLLEWLLLMPKLKVLSFRGDDDFEDIEDVNLEDYPLPELRFLERMDIFHLPPLQIVSHLIRTNKKISKLCISPKIGHDVFTVIVHLPELKDLFLHCPEDDIVEQLASPKVNWALETIKLSYCRAFFAAPLFRVIQDKFADTLVSLDLSFREKWCASDPNADEVQTSLWEDCKNLRLDLPKLKNIQIDLSKTPVCLDFLLPMKSSLEKISASYQDELRLPSRLATGHIIQYVGFNERMLESNIWEIFEKLKEFEVFSSRTFPDDPKTRHYHYYFRRDWKLSKNNA